MPHLVSILPRELTLEEVPPLIAAFILVPISEIIFERDFTTVDGLVADTTRVELFSETLVSEVP